MSIQQRNALADALWGHHYETYSMNPDGTERSYCQCGAPVYPVKSLVQHHAEVALEHLKPRTIESAYEDDGPDSLPPLSVVLSGGKPAIRQYDHTWMDYDGGTWDDWEMEYPLTVLYVPEPNP